MKYLVATAAALGLSIAATAPLHAQSVNANNLVTVSLTNVIDDISVDLQVSENQIPVTVQVPMDVAANVCPNVDVSALAQQAACTADSTSQALNQAVQRQLQG